MVSVRGHTRSPVEACHLWVSRANPSLRPTYFATYSIFRSTSVTVSLPRASTRTSAPVTPPPSISGRRAAPQPRRVIPLPFTATVSIFATDDPDRAPRLRRRCHAPALTPRSSAPPRLLRVVACSATVSLELVWNNADASMPAKIGDALIMPARTRFRNPNYAV